MPVFAVKTEMTQVENTKYLEVFFQRDEKNNIKGNPIDKMGSGGKIVFILGYKPERFATWRGALPQIGEKWLCEVVRDTLPESASHGAYIVSLIENLSLLQNLRDEKEANRLRVIIQGPPELQLNKAQKIETFANNFAKANGLKRSTILLPEILKIGKNLVHRFQLEETKTTANPIFHSNMDLIAKEAEIIGISFAMLVDRTLAWLEHLSRIGSGETTFINIGKKNFRCEKCGAITRMPKNVYSEYFVAEKVELVCDNCGAKGPAL